MLRFIDGWDHYAIGDIFGKWSSGSVAGSGVASIITTTTVRTGAGALQLGRTGTVGDSVTTTVGALAPTVICGFGFRHGGGGDTIFFVLGDGSTAASGAQIGLRLTAAGLIDVWRNNDNVIGIAPGRTSVTGAVSLGASTSALAINQWNYIEVKATIHNSAGAVEVRVNGSSAGWISLSGIDTQFTANAYASVIGLGGLAVGPTFYDDLYLADTVAGDGITDFLGPQKIGSVIASAGNGTHTDFTPSTGTDHGALVDDAAPNGDTDYVSSSTVGHRDSYNFPALGVVGTVTAVQAVQWAKLDVSGARAINSFARISSSNYDHATPTALDTTYRAARAIWTTSPATAGAWTIAEVDGAEFGVRVQA